MPSPRKESERDFAPPERVHLEGRQYALVPPGDEVLRAVHVNRAHRPNLEATAREGVADRDSRPGRGEPSGAAVPNRASSPAPSSSKVSNETLSRACAAYFKAAGYWPAQMDMKAALRAALEVTDE